MKRLFVMLTIGLVMVAGNVGAVPVIDAKDEKAYLESQKAIRPVDVGDFQVNGQVVTPEEFDKINKEQAKDRMDKFEEIRKTAVVGKDEYGRTQYTTPDGVKHSFGGDDKEVIGVDAYVERQKANDKAAEENIDFMKKRYYQAQADAQKYGWTDADEAKAKAENGKFIADVAAKNQAEADRVGLSKW